jgi:pimeloyl-ACP methyl ester carboxylesterase
MAYMDVPPGTEPNGKTVVLMHGKAFGGCYFRNVIEALTGAGYRVVVPDQIGWGKSPKPDVHYSFQLLAANTAALLDHLGVGGVAVLGHSTGGMTAVRFTGTSRTWSIRPSSSPRSCHSSRAEQRATISTCWPYAEDETKPTAASRFVNDQYARLVERCPGRFRAFAALPMLLQRADDQYRWEAPDTPEQPSLAARRMWYDTVGHGHVRALPPGYQLKLQVIASEP